MKQKKILKLGMVLLLAILFLPLIFAASRSTPQYTQYLSEGTSDLDNAMCQQGGQDFILQIAPFDCTPAVVTSDLLLEQNVPVFCQISATKINPLIEVEAIESISFSGEYPPEVEEIAFHPSQAALDVDTSLSDDALLNDIGYVVIVLRKQDNTSSMPDYVTGNLTAKITYDVQSSFGIGDASFYLSELEDSEWEENKYQYGFWEGKGALKAESIGEDNAIISVYAGDDKISTVSLEKGEESEEIYFPGFECWASLKLKLKDLENPDTRAVLRVNSDVVEVGDGEKFLDNKCRITDLERQGLMQQVGIKCLEDDGANTFDLVISPKIKLRINEIEREVELGERLYSWDEGEKSVYVGYIGTKGDASDVNDLFIVLISSPQHKDKLSERELAKYNLFVGELFEQDKSWSGLIEEVSDEIKKIAGAVSLLINFLARGESLYWVNYGGEGNVFDTNISIIDFSEPTNKILKKNTKKYYGWAVEDYEEVLNTYLGERYPSDDDITLDEKALYQEIVLAWNLQQKETVIELCKIFETEYSDPYKDVTRCCDNEYGLSNQERASEYVTINGVTKSITLDGIYEPSAEEYSAEIFVSNAKEYNGGYILRKNKEVYISANESIFLKELGTGYAIFDVSNVEYEKLKEILYDPKNLKLEKGDYEVIGKNNYRISLEEINLKKVAKISLSPSFQEGGSEASFDFNIGIEQSLIELTPDMIQSQIDFLDTSISRWQNISHTLNATVKGLKTACLATGLALTAKTLLSGGEGLARQVVMSNSGGWYEKCADMVSEGTYSSQDQCLLQESDKIDTDVAVLSALMIEQNDIIKDLEKDTTKIESFGKTVVDTNQFMEKYSDWVTSSLKNTFGGSIDDPNGAGDSIDMEDMLTTLSYEGWQNRNYNVEQLKEIELYASVLTSDGASSELKQIAEESLYSVLLDVQINAENYAELSKWASQLGTEVRDIPFIRLGEQVKKISYGGWTSESLGNPIPDITGNTPIGIVLASNGEKYFMVLDSHGDKLTINQTDNGGSLIYNSKGVFVGNPPDEIRNIYFQEYDASFYENEYKNPELSYYETEPYKGLPAIVPFDLDNGWYAGMKQTIAVFGSEETYTDAGAINSFYLCNVGENGLEENVGGDDICEMINLGTNQPYDQFPGLEEDNSEELVEDAQKAITQASNAYSSHMSGTVRILGQNIKVGSPAVDIPETQCTDLMSPKECNLLFNVCDPVICPSSRCDLGGTYPVQNVAQTGIIGSIVLCLPNFQEGILIPVCLTGVKAGVDAWLSVESSYRDCLQEALDTGELVGICDEIYSIYVCEFFWEQAVPLADLAIPNLLSIIAGEGTRGGGEYLFMQNAWDTSEEALTYFTQYASSAFSAFETGAIEKIGSEFCKMAISGTYTDPSDLLATLTEADSPAQYTGWFEETSFTSATVPPTSHYKVFYHIYAGQGGAYYQVYLKGLPSSSYYQDSSSTLSIGSGYIESGSYATETRDLTGVSGYQELCISVNGEEECGFSEVSTSFAVDYVTDSYIASQAEEDDIKTTATCIGDSEVGIVRVCATADPGKGTDPYAGTETARWREVGYCEDENMICWLDTDSIEDSIDVSIVEEEALDTITEDYIAELREKEGYISEERFATSLRKIENEKNASDKVRLIEELLDGVFLNSEKAYLYLLRGNAYAQFILEGAGRADGTEAEDEEGEMERGPSSSGEEEESSSTGGGTGESNRNTEEEINDSEYIKRYKKIEKEFNPAPGWSLFTYYSAKNKPDTLDSSNEFKAMLVAIAEKRSNLGYPDGEYNSKWLMGYYSGYPVNEHAEQDAGAIRQVASASNILKIGLNRDRDRDSPYYACRRKLLKKNLIKCVLKVYLTENQQEPVEEVLSEGYAREIMKRMEFWEGYFESQREVTPGQVVREITD